MKRKPLQLFVWFIFLGIILSPSAQLYAASSYSDLANEFGFAVCVNTSFQHPPKISGNIVVWQDDRNDTGDIYGKNLLTGEEFPICTHSGQQSYPAISGNNVVWVDERNGIDDIYRADITNPHSPIEYPVCTAPGAQSRPAIDGDYVVWLDGRGLINAPPWYIYGKKLSTGEEFIVCSNTAAASPPAIYGNKVVWKDSRNPNSGIYGYNIQTGEEFPICTNIYSAPQFPAIYENTVVWADTRNQRAYDVYGADITDIQHPKEFPVHIGSVGAGAKAAIYNNIVLWSDHRRGSSYSDIYGKDLTTDQEFPVCTAGYTGWPVIDGNTCVWWDYRNTFPSSTNPDIFRNKVLQAIVLEKKQLSFDPVGASASDPVNTLTGNFYHNETDLAIPGPGMNFEFARAYNSLDSYSGPFGLGWTHTYNVFLQPDVNMPFIQWGDGQGHYYLPDVGIPNSYHPAISAIYGNLKKNPDNSWTLTQKNQTRFEFNTSSKLTSIIDKNNNIISLAYDGNGRLNQITDTSGRLINIVYNASGLVQSVTDPNNRQIIYGYTNGKLTSVTDANGNPEYYGYDPGNGKLKTITDRRGIVTLTNVYDSYGRVIQQINGRGKVSSFAYNTPGQNKATITDPLGRQTVHTYDAYLRLISITDPCGHSISYTYDNKGNRTSITDQKGNVRYFTYDGMGNVLTMTAPQIDHNDPITAAVTKTTYDPNTNNPLTKTDANGTTLARTWVYQYDSKGNLIRTIDPNGGQSLRTYTAKGLLATETDAVGHTTGYIYDTQGNLTDINDAQCNITHYTYDAVGRILTKTDARGNTATYRYDKNNNLIAETDPNGKAITYAYDKNNNKTSMTDKRGHTWTYYYNENNILNREVDPNGFETLYGYDNADNRTSVKDKRGKTTMYTYDVLNRLINVSDPLGHHSSYAYDAKGNKISQTNALSKTWTYKYDALDRLIEEKDPLGNTTKYEYDLLGRKTAVIDARGSRTQYGYDKLDRLIQATDALGNITRYQYDPVGNLTTITNANNKLSTRQYDALNRLISESDPLGNTTHYQYDHVGNLVTKIDAMDQTTNYSYDQLNRLIDISYPDSTTVHYAYDENGNRIAMTDWNGTSSFEYDALNRMAASVDAFGNSIDYLYDAAGNREAIIYPDGNFVIYDYDTAGRLDTVIDWNGSETWYDYDAADNLQGVLLPNGAYQFYTYDDASRLISVDNFDSDSATIGTFQYTLDAVGNRIEINETGTLDPIIPYSNANYAYDDADRILTGGSCSYSFNDNGDQISLNCGGDVTQYYYDPKDLLVGVNKSSLNIEHTYDGAGNRIAKVSNGTEKRYVLDLGSSMSQVLCETNSSGTITAYYIYGAGLISKITPDGSQRYYHYDGIGSTAALTNQSGVLTDRYAYSPFGEILNTQGSTNNPFKFVGRFGVMTESDGSLFMRARFYEPTNGRFLSKDPVPGKITIPLTFNLYEYALNNPTINNDPEGKIAPQVFAFAVGFVWGEFSAFATGPALDLVLLSGLGTPQQAQSFRDNMMNVAASSTGMSLADPTLTAQSFQLGAWLGKGTVNVVYGTTQNLTRNIARVWNETPTYNPLAPPDYDATVPAQIPKDIKINIGSGFTSGGGGTGGNTSPGNSSQVKPQVNVPVFVSTNPQTYSQTYTSTTRKYR